MIRFLTLSLFALLSCASLPGARADDPPPGDVSLTVKAEGEQPKGKPVVVELTLTNIGTTPISWWCGGPDRYPGAEHFIVQVRYGGQTEWHTVKATNGQYVQGSGVLPELKPRDSIVVPLAIPVEPTDAVSFSIRPASWHIAKSIEGYIQVVDRQAPLDQRRARMIEAVTAGNPPFWEHVAAQYPDPVVLDALLKLATVDNAPIASRALRILARQKVLPESAGADFALLLNRWFAPPLAPEGNGMRYFLPIVALKTGNEQARAIVLKTMTDAQDTRMRWDLIDALRQSHGDAVWLRRARAAVVALQQSQPDDKELARETKLATDWLDSSIQHPE